MQIPFQIKLNDRSTVTNLLDEELLKDVIKKSKKRREEKRRKDSILLEIPRVSDYYRYTIIKVENKESKKRKKIMENAAIHYVM